MKKRLFITLIPLFASISLIAGGYSSWVFNGGDTLSSQGIGVTVTEVKNGEKYGSFTISNTQLSITLDQKENNIYSDTNGVFLSSDSTITLNPNENNDDILTPVATGETYYLYNFFIKFNLSTNTYVNQLMNYITIKCEDASKINEGNEHIKTDITDSSITSKDNTVCLYDSYYVLGSEAKSSDKTAASHTISLKEKLSFEFKEDKKPTTETEYNNLKDIVDNINSSQVTFLSIDISYKAESIDKDKYDEAMNKRSSCDYIFPKSSN